jgi:pimeloyl-ACP methyl ester carboxylesterase
MTTVLIHGVPDTARVWSKLVPLLGQGETVALSLPGFGCPMAPGFEATKEGYVAWLMAALDSIPAPRDVIAHDWGSILILRVLSLRPDLIRSWVGGGAPYSSDYTWHPTARLWQTPGAGEKAMDRLTEELSVEMLKRAGVPDADARAASRDIDDRMKAAILSLYRSGRDVFREWGPDLAGNERPGLVLWGERDAYADPIYADRLGEVTCASVVRLDCGHWWQVERPQETAQAVLSFWRGVGL